MVARVLAGRYELVRFVGRGGMGEVWEGRDRVIARRIAVKLLTHDVRDTSGAALFLREARVAGGLTHPGVVTVHDLGQDPDEGTLFLVMEFLTGRDLATVLLEDGPPPVGTAVDWAVRASAALAAAHDAGVVHRDIKPANLMLTTSGGVKVLDFGIARYVESTNRSSKVMGTLAYMPPERFDDHPGDARSDLYSLGCVLHELLTGNTPFDATGPVSMMNAHVNRAPQPPGAIRSGVPAWLDDLVLALLAKDPARRPASALEVVEQLTRLTPHPASKSSAASPARTGPGPAATSAGSMPTVPRDSTNARPTSASPRNPHHAVAPLPSTVTAPQGAAAAKQPGYTLVRVLSSESVRWVDAVALSPDCRTLAAGGIDGNVGIWDLHTGEQLSVLPSGPKRIHALAFSPDGRSLAVGGADDTVRLWDPATGMLRAQLTGYTWPVGSLAFSPDGRILATGTLRECRLWEAPTGTGLRGLADAKGPVAFSPDGQTLVTQDENGLLCRWDPRSGKRRRRWHVEDGGNLTVTEVAFSPDGRLLAGIGHSTDAANGDRAVHVWEADTGRRRHHLTGHTDNVTSLAFSPDGRVLAAGDKSGAIIVRDPTTGTQLQVLATDSAGLTAVAFSPDGTTLTAGHQNGNIHLWTRG